MNKSNHWFWKPQIFYSTKMNTILFASISILVWESRQRVMFFGCVWVRYNFLKNYIHFILFNIYLYLYSSNLSGIRFLDRALRETAVGNALCFSNLHVCLLIPDTFLFEADAPHTLHWRSTCPLQNPLIRLLGVSRRARPGVGTLPARRSDTVNKPCASWSEGGRSDSFSEGWRVGGSGSVPAQPGWCQSAHHPPTAHTPPLRLPSLHVGNQHSFVKAN